MGIVSIANRAKEELMKISGEFGLTPAARTRIEVRAAGGDGSGTGDFF